MTYYVLQHKFYPEEDWHDLSVNAELKGDLDSCMDYLVDVIKKANYGINRIVERTDKQVAFFAGRPVARPDDSKPTSSDIVETK